MKNALIPTNTEPLTKIARRRATEEDYRAVKMTCQ